MVFTGKRGAVRTKQSVVPYDRPRTTLICSPTPPSRTYTRIDTDVLTVKLSVAAFRLADKKIPYIQQGLRIDQRTNGFTRFDDGSIRVSILMRVP